MYARNDAGRDDRAPRPPKPVLRRSSPTLLAPLLLVALGCSGLFSTPKSTIERDIAAHLTTRYGGDFAITRITSESSAAIGFVDRHRFEAHPVGDPSFDFQGGADYTQRPPIIYDTFACEKVRRWLPDIVRDDLGAPLRLASVDVYCGAGLPAEPVVGGPLPPGIVTVHLKVETFAQGDRLQAIAAARETVQRAAARRGIEAKGEITCFPAALRPQVQAVAMNGREAGFPAEDWSAMARATDRIQPRHGPILFERALAIEAQVAGLLAERHPTARIAVQTRTAASGTGRTLIDARIAAADLDEGAVRATADALGATVDAGWTLRALDRASIDEPLRTAFVCRPGAGRHSACQRVTATLIDPGWAAADAGAGGP